MTQQNVSFSDNINAFNGFMTTMTNVMNKTKNIGYSSNKNLTTIAGITNCEALGVLGQPVALKSELSSKADVNHNHDSSYSAINHTHLTSEISQQYEEEETNNEEETITITKTRTLDSVLDGKADVQHNHDLTYAPLNHTHNDYALTNHNHDLAYSQLNHTHLTSEISQQYEEEEDYIEEEDGELITKTRIVSRSVPLDDVLSDTKEVMATNTSNIDTMASSVNTLATSIQDYIDTLDDSNSVNGDVITITANLGSSYAKKSDIATSITTAALTVNGNASATGTIVGTNVLSNNETRLSAAEGEISSLQSGKANSSHTHTLNEITDYTAPDLTPYATTSAMNTALSGKSDTSHNHDSTYSALGHKHLLSDIYTIDNEEEEETLDDILDGKSDVGHTHTLSEITNYTAPDLSGYATTSHNHDSTYAKLNATNTFTANQTINGIIFSETASDLMGQFFNTGTPSNKYMMLGKDVSNSARFGYVHSDTTNDRAAFIHVVDDIIKAYPNRCEILKELIVNDDTTVNGTLDVNGYRLYVGPQLLNPNNVASINIGGGDSRGYYYQGALSFYKGSDSGSDMLSLTIHRDDNCGLHITDATTSIRNALSVSGNTTMAGALTVPSITLNGNDLATTLSSKADSVHDHTSVDITNWATATSNFAKTNAANTFTAAQTITRTGAATMLSCYNKTTNGDSYIFLGNNNESNSDDISILAWCGDNTAANRRFAVYVRGQAIQKWYKDKAELLFPLTVYGTITCSSLTQTSDERLKENVEEMNDNIIDNVKVYSFNLKNDERKHYGVIAQELQEIAPELVYDSGGEEHMLSVNYTELIPHLINKCKQQDKRIQELESKIDMLIERLK